MVIAAFVLLAATMCARVVYLHVIDKDFLQDQGDARTNRIEKISAHRGMILDRHGKPLAISTPVVSIWANPKEMFKKDVDLNLLAKALGIDEDKFSKKLKNSAKKSFVYLRRRMVPDLAQKVLDLKIKGIHSEREYQRYYPAGEVSAHIVGFTNVDDHGQEGIELSFDEWLEGKPGKKKVLKNLYGEIVRDIMPLVEAEPGKNLELSIDLRLQYLAYKELKTAVSLYGAASGSAVILDVKTGEILSMVNQPSYNPNNRSKLKIASVRNRAATDVFEPGSTVKPFVVATALDAGQYQFNSTIDTHPGYVKVGSKTIPDPRNYGVLDMGGIIAKSSQVGISKLALTLDAQEVWQKFSAIGFGKDTGIGFPGERAGYLPNRRNWKDIERATFAYGYGFQVTPLQLAAAYQVIAAGGMKRELSLLSGELGPETRVFSKKTARELTTMLTRVVAEGTGSRAAIEGYTVAGKTGTARKVGKNGYEDTRHLAFFAGLTPAENPRLVGVVMINDPKSAQGGGGTIAAPVFSRIMTEALRLLSVPPSVPLTMSESRLSQIGGVV